MTTLHTWDWIVIASCAGHLALATIALRRLSASPLALPLGLLCLDLFVFNAADVANHVAPAAQWRWLDATFTSLLVPLTIRFVLVFVGRRRPLAWLVWGFDLYFGAITLACAGAFFGVGWSQDFAGREGWARAVAPGAAAAIGVLTWLFAAHLRRSPSLLEKERTWLIIGGFALGTIGNVCDLLVGLGFDIPRLGPIGLFFTTLVLTVVALRIGLFGHRISWLIAANALVLGVLQLTGYFAVFSIFGGNSTVLAIGLGTLTLALVPALVAMTRAAAAHRQRLEHHATLGLLFAQMEHDLRTPIGTLSGNAEILKEKLKRGLPPAELEKNVEAILAASNRVIELVNDHRRRPELEPRLAPLDLNALVEQIVGPQALAAREGVKFERVLETHGARCEADRELIARAVENLVKNAVEALPKEGGVVTVRTELRASDPGFVRLSVSDTGDGIDPRQVALVSGGGVTTKQTGSGLGLSFASRIAEAHGGKLEFSSEERRGSTATLRLPIPL